MKMGRFSLNILSILIITFTSGNIITENPYAVSSSFRSLGLLYLQLRNPNPRDRPRDKTKELTPKLKWDICKKIFNREVPLFNSFNESYEILLDPKVLESKLRHDFRYQNIFHDIFEIVPRPMWDLRRGYRYRHENRSKLRNIIYQGALYQENTFLCLVTDAQLNEDNIPVPVNMTFKQYYVSDSEYNMNEVPNGDHVGGRFIFLYMHNMQHLVIHALAEESPYLIENLVEAHYLERRYSFRPTNSREEDPICRLDFDRKFRLCNSVLLEVQKLVDSRIFVQSECTQKSFAFKGEFEDMYEEWMIGCEIDLSPQRDASSITSDVVSTGSPINATPGRDIFSSGSDWDSFSSQSSDKSGNVIRASSNVNVGVGSSNTGDTLSPTRGKLPSASNWDYRANWNPSDNLSSTTQNPISERKTGNNEGSSRGRTSSSPSRDDSVSIENMSSSSSWTNSNLTRSNLGSGNILELDKTLNRTDTQGNLSTDFGLISGLNSSSAFNFKFYVSRSYKDNEVFVFLTDVYFRTVLHGYKTKVSMVIDKPSSNLKQT